MSRKAVIFGAGNIGRGFIGQLFSESGYEVVFIDVDTELIAALNDQRQYHLEIVGNDGKQDLQIGPVRAIHGNDREAVAAAVAEAQIGATAVGANALKYIVGNLAAGLKLRAAAGKSPINFIICENLHGAAEHVRSLVSEQMGAGDRAGLQDWVGFVDTVIGRMVPVPTPEMRAEDVSLVRVEAYKELPVAKRGFVGEIPVISAMTAYDDFEVFTARKLYIHNCGHALMAYTGFLRGYEFGYEAMADRAVRDFMLAGLRESAAAICAQFQASPDWLNAHVDDLLQRFTNRMLGDRVFRLGRDPIRKLAREDRLVGAACLAQANGISPRYLCWGIAAALLFNPADDPAAQTLQRRIVEVGAEAAFLEVSGLGAGDLVAALVLQAYQALVRNPQALP
ncbi:MAG: mannitol-1-phosphate 5-dehydrogenase [Oligosphaeraceae bacterium]|nr:mannitol-1-phosphate 5-dehydrogenase [Oligosphaeraceae bacterium]